MISNLVKECTGCSACANICHVKAIKMDINKEGFTIPKVDEEICVSCKKCLRVCQLVTNIQPTISSNSEFFIGWNKDSEERKQASSGGIFGAMATWVISQGGIVFGAAFSYEFNSVIHCSTDEVSLIELKKSKYVESKIDRIYPKVRESLLQDRWVLVCGTPCQIRGIKKFLGKEYDKLILCDFLCHGVPSSKVFTKYIDEIEKRNKEKIKYIDFRSKRYGWKTYSLELGFESGSKIIRTGIEDPYYRLFFSNISLRKACYTCKRNKETVADITLGDFWGINKYKQIYDTDEGISLFSSHTIKGEKILKSINETIKIEQLPKQYANYAYLNEDKNSELRESFFGKIDDKNFNIINNEFLKPLSIKNKINSMLRKSEISRKILYKIIR